jgi:hypothetical protein
MNWISKGFWTAVDKINKANDAYERKCEKVERMMTPDARTFDEHIDDATTKAKVAVVKHTSTSTKKAKRVLKKVVAQAKTVAVPVRVATCPVDQAIESCSDALLWMSNNPSDNTVVAVAEGVACTVTLYVEPPTPAPIPIPKRDKYPSHRQVRPSLLRRVVRTLSGDQGNKGSVEMAPIMEVR